MRYFTFFYEYLTKTREGSGSVWLNFDDFPSNTEVCEIVCETVKNEPDLTPECVAVTNWIEMNQRDFDNFIGLTEEAPATPVIHKTAVDHIQNCTFETYCGQTFNTFDDNILTSNTDYDCPDCIAVMKEDQIHSELKNLKRDFETIKRMCVELLRGADKCSNPPHYIVQPFMGIVKRYSKIINKYKLWESEE